MTLQTGCRWMELARGSGQVFDATQTAKTEVHRNNCECRSGARMLTQQCNTTCRPDSPFT